MRPAGTQCAAGGGSGEAGREGGLGRAGDLLGRGTAAGSRMGHGGGAPGVTCRQEVVAG